MLLVNNSRLFNPLSDQLFFLSRHYWQSGLLLKFQLISSDLPFGGGYDAILSMVDYGLIKGVIFIPCIKTFLALDMA